jgi:hypothetical protein
MVSDASGGPDSKSRAARPLTLVMGVLAVIGGIGKLFEDLPKLVLNEHQLWITEFLPDLVIVLVLGCLVTLLRPNRIAWIDSLRRARSQTPWQFTFLCVLAVAAAILAGFFWKPLRELYQVRYQRASVDWHEIRALDLMRQHDYEAARREFLKASHKSTDGKLAAVQADVDGRLRDARELISRFESYRKAGKPLTFDQLLMIGRAHRLAPRAAYVTSAMADGQRIVEEALMRYLKGVERIKQGDAAGAAEELRRSRAVCKGLLHQDLLLRFTGNRHLEAYSAEEQGLINYYLKTSMESLRAKALKYPPIRIFRGGS